MCDALDVECIRQILGCQRVISRLVSVRIRQEVRPGRLHLEAAHILKQLGLLPELYAFHWST